MTSFENLKKQFNIYNPLIFDLQELSPSKIVDSSADVLFSNNISYPQLSLGFQHYIHKAKDKMELTEKYSNRKKIYLVTSLFEKNIDFKEETDLGLKYQSIGDGVDKFIKEVNPSLPPLLNRAYLKLWEILVMFDLIPDKDDFTSSHLCEGPGSFIQATIYFRELQEKLGQIKTSSKDNYYGVTLHSDHEHLLMQQDFIKYFNKEKTKRLHVLETKSVDKIKDMYGGGYKGMLTNGDLTKINTIRLFGGAKDTDSFAKPSDLVTADGGFDWKKENLQEQEAYKLIYSEIVTAIKVQKNGGNFVLKIFESYTHTTLKFIELLRYFYKEVYICKPYTSRISNSEKYIVCKNFDKSKVTQSIIKKLEEMIITFGKNENFNIIDIFTDYKISKKNLDAYTKINIQLMIKQYLGINNIVLFDNLDNKNGIEYNQFLDKQIDAAVFWNELFLDTKNYSKMSKFIKDFDFLKFKSKLDEESNEFDESEKSDNSDKLDKSFDARGQTMSETETEIESEKNNNFKKQSRIKALLNKTMKSKKDNSKKVNKSRKTQKGGGFLDEQNEQNEQDEDVFTTNIIQNYEKDMSDNSSNELIGKLDSDDEFIDLNKF